VTPAVAVALTLWGVVGSVRVVRVTVLGAGVIGLTCAHALRSAGFDVRVVARDEPIVSRVAGGLWLPYATARDERVLRWALQTLDWLEEERGHPVTSYLHLERETPWWVEAMPANRVRAAHRHERPDGYARGWICRVPLVPMGPHLDALGAGLAVEHRYVQHLAELDGLVVNCTGLGARALTGDNALVAVRGQVVHVRAPAGTPCVCDEDALVYVLPRPDVCVVGGSAEHGDEDLAPREAQTASILANATRLVPALRDAPVVGARVGLRPVRDGGPRVQREGDVIHCYGHGGSGLTLSHGCASEVVRLARTA
jgi:D-amino-acid oxidase